MDTVIMYDHIEKITHIVVFVPIQYTVTVTCLFTSYNVEYRLLICIDV